MSSVHQIPVQDSDVLYPWRRRGIRPALALRQNQIIEFLDCILRSYHLSHKHQGDSPEEGKADHSTTE